MALLRKSAMGEVIIDEIAVLIIFMPMPTLPSENLKDFELKVATFRYPLYIWPNFCLTFPRLTRHVPFTAKPANDTC